MSLPDRTFDEGHRVPKTTRFDSPWYRISDKFLDLYSKLTNNTTLQKCLSFSGNVER